MSDRVHIVPHEEGWALKREGASKVESVHPTQKAAIDAGRDLARDDEVDLVVHRQDGTFRTVLSYTNEPMSDKTNGNGKKVEAHDLHSVGSRVSWGAVAAGAAIALALNAVLWMGGIALGITVSDQVSIRTLTIGAAIWMLMSSLFSLFVGGFMVSRLTAGEDRQEAATYGVILWGLVFIGSLMLANSGIATGTQMASMKPSTASESWLNKDVFKTAQLSDSQIATIEAKRSEAQAAVGELDSKSAAWWAFTSLILSLGAAVAGSWLGAGPEFVLVRFTRRAPVATPTV
jgi:hypothetical protein